MKEGKKNISTGGNIMVILHFIYKYQLNTRAKREHSGSQGTVAVSVNDWRAVVFGRNFIARTLEVTFFPSPSDPPSLSYPSAARCISRAIAFLSSCESESPDSSMDERLTRDPGDNIGSGKNRACSPHSPLPLPPPLSLSRRRLSTTTISGRSNMCQRRRNGEWKLARRELVAAVTSRICVYHVSFPFIFPLLLITIICPRTCKKPLPRSSFYILSLFLSWRSFYFSFVYHTIFTLFSRTFWTTIVSKLLNYWRYVCIYVSSLVLFLSSY